jgi:ribulose-phosphate 3-epimerase
MMTNPEEFIPEFIEAGSNYITVHVETCPHLHRTIQSIKEKGVKAGVTLNPATLLVSIEEILPEVDLLLIMSVNPGFGGQSFIGDLGKLKRQKMIDDRGLKVELEIDGGVKPDNMASLSRQVRHLCVSSAIFGNPDKTTIKDAKSYRGVDAKRSHCNEQKRAIYLVTGCFVVLPPSQ